MARATGAQMRHEPAHARHGAGGDHATLPISRDGNLERDPLQIRLGFQQSGTRFRSASVSSRQIRLALPTYEWNYQRQLFAIRAHDQRLAEQVVPLRAIVAARGC